MEELIVGIDLGTTNSALSWIENGQTHILTIHGMKTLPSCVGLAPDGKLIVGQTARNQLIAAPDATVLSIKRKMGTDERVRLKDKEFSPEEISSLILKELKEEAEKTLGRPVKKAVITVPAFFSERQRKATQVAGELAGLEVARIINEPTAAALAYGADKTESETMLVYDLGGGTFDVSVVVVEHGVVEVKASRGDTQLGGDDFDKLLVNYAKEQFEKQHEVALRDDPSVEFRLKIAMERAKWRLSDEPFTTIKEEFLQDDKHLEFEISRNAYEEMIFPLLEKTLSCCHQALQDANLKPGNISKVMLVGGSTRTPMVHSLLSARLDLEPRFEIDPDLIVAMGAAAQGAIINGQTHDSILIDITPHTYSVEAASYFESEYRLVCCPIISRNTPLPVSKTEVFQTATDNQKEVEIKVHQGEMPLPALNALVGNFMIEGLSKAPRGNLILIRYDLDLNGILKVTALEKSTGLSKTVTLDTRSVKALDMTHARKNLAELFEAEHEGHHHDEDEEEDLTGDVGDVIEAEVVESSDDEASRPLLATARDLRERAQALLVKGVAGEEITEIKDLMHNSAKAIRGRDWTTLRKANETLGDLVFYLED